MLTWIINNNTIRLSRGNMDPRIEIRPSVGWNRLFKGLFLVEIEFKWLHERLNQTLVCRAAKLKLWCNLFTPFNRMYQATLYNSWFATTWQGGHVEGQYTIIFLEEFTWKQSQVIRGEKYFCSWPPIWPPRPHVQTSNGLSSPWYFSFNSDWKKASPGLLTDILLSKVFPLFFLAKDL